MQDALEALKSGALPIIMLAIRMLVPVLALYVVWRSYTSYKKSLRRKDPVIILVDHYARTKYPVLYWENSIGRDKSCDIVLPDAMVSRDHAVLMRRDEGWMVYDTESKGGVFVNGEKVEDSTIVNVGDEILVGATSLMLLRREDAGSGHKKMFRGFTQHAASPVKLMVVATLVLLLQTFQLSLTETGITPWPYVCFAALFVIGWGLYAYSVGYLRRVSFEIETVAFMLSGIGILLLYGIDQNKGSSMALTQLVAMTIGVCIFSFMIWFMGDLDRVEKYRRYIAIGAIAVFLLTLALGSTVNGSRNWIRLGSLSLQPSELIKIVFILFGASSLNRLQTKRNMQEFLIFAAICMGFLFLMKDFGTALIYFATFLIIAFMRSGSFRTIALILVAIAFLIMIVFVFIPNLSAHVLDRFSGWGKIWEDPDNKGWQQTRMLIYLASGGLFGVGLGDGYFYSIFGSENDAVFGVICEEQGMLLGLVLLFALGLFIFYSRSDVTRSRSTFYSITSCAAAGLLVFQTILNVLGSTDIIPFTGVTLPFISAGGTSMMSAWGMMAFIKASDERTYAAKRMSRRQRKEERLRREREAEYRQLMETEAAYRTGRRYR